MNTNEIGRYIKKILKDQNRLQKELAEYLNVSEQVLSNNLRGANQLSVDKLIRISQFLSLPVEQLIYDGMGYIYAGAYPYRVVEKVYSEPSEVSLLDTVINNNHIGKFKEYYSKNLFKEEIHKNFKLATFFVKNNMVDYLSKKLPTYSYIDGKLVLSHNQFDLIVRVNLAEEEDIDSKTLYKRLNKEQKEFFNAISSCRDIDILSAVPNVRLLVKRANKRTRKSGKDTKHYLLLRIAIEQGNNLLFEYISGINRTRMSKTFLDYANKYNRTNIAKYIFINMEDKVLENLYSINDSDFQDEWKGKLGYS